MSEGHALTPFLTVTLPEAAGGGNGGDNGGGGNGVGAAYVAGGFADARVLTTLAMGGTGGDEISGGLPITRGLEAPCAEGGGDGGGTHARCFGARLSLHPLYPALAALPSRQNAAHHFHTDDNGFNVTAVEGAARKVGTAAISDGDGVFPTEVGVPTPSCLGLSLYVRYAGEAGCATVGCEQPAHRAFSPYLTMAAHGIIASESAER